MSPLSPLGNCVSQVGNTRGKNYGKLISLLGNQFETVTDGEGGMKRNLVPPTSYNGTVHVLKKNMVPATPRVQFTNLHRIRVKYQPNSIQASTHLASLCYGVTQKKKN